MTAALDAMVKAMRAEMEAQEDGGLVRDAYKGKPTEVYVDATIDLERVARAGLAAIRQRGGDLMTNVWSCVVAEDPLGAVHSIIDEITGEQP